MSNSYYYFAASLPMLDFNGEPPMSVESFLAECANLLNPQDYEFVNTLISRRVVDYDFLQNLLKNSKSGIKPGNAVFEEGARFNRSFRNELAAFRAEKASKDANQFVRGYRDPTAQVLEAIQNADKAENPLEGEKVLDKMRWDFLENLGVMHHYNLESIILYGVKLKILVRHQLFRSEKGKEVLDQLKQIKGLKNITEEKPSE